MIRKERKQITMAFSKADRVIISLGRIFFSRRFRMTGPIELHSSFFSGDSAGNDDEPGNDIPMASIALAIVFAVYILVKEKYELSCKRTDVSGTHSSTCTRSRTCVSYSIVPFPLCGRCPSVLQVFSVGLKGRYDVQLWRSFTGSCSDGTPVYHHTRTI